MKPSVVSAWASWIKLPSRFAKRTISQSSYLTSRTTATSSTRFAVAAWARVLARQTSARTRARNRWFCTLVPRHPRIFSAIVIVFYSTCGAKRLKRFEISRRYNETRRGKRESLYRAKPKIVHQRSRSLHRRVTFQKINRTSRSPFRLLLLLLLPEQQQQRRRRRRRPQPRRRRHRRRHQRRRWR